VILESDLQTARRSVSVAEMVMVAVVEWDVEPQIDDLRL
jgi:hypothetical protein